MIIMSYNDEHFVFKEGGINDLRWETLAAELLLLGKNVLNRGPSQLFGGAVELATVLQLRSYLLTWYTVIHRHTHSGQFTSQLHCSVCKRVNDIELQLQAIITSSSLAPSLTRSSFSVLCLRSSDSNSEFGGECRWSLFDIFGCIHIVFLESPPKNTYQQLANTAKSWISCSPSCEIWIHVCTYPAYRERQRNWAITFSVCSMLRSFSR